MAKAGRPSRAGKPTIKTIGVRVTKDELAAWTKAAGERSLIDWIREQCNRAAKG